MHLAYILSHLVSKKVNFVAKKVRVYIYTIFEVKVLHNIKYLFKYNKKENKTSLDSYLLIYLYLKYAYTLIKYL